MHLMLVECIYMLFLLLLSVTVFAFSLFPLLPLVSRSSENFHLTLVSHSSVFAHLSAVFMIHSDVCELVGTLKLYIRSQAKNAPPYSSDERSYACTTSGPTFRWVEFVVVDEVGLGAIVIRDA